MKPIYLKPDQSVVFVAMKDEPTIFPFGPIAELIAVGKRPFIVGEFCYVREAWRVGAWNEENCQIAIDYKDGPCKKWLYVEDEELFERLWIESTDDAEKAGMKVDEEGKYRWEPGQSPCRWRSPVTMPEWASRRHVRIVSCEPIQQDGKWKWRVEVKEVKA